MTSKAYAVTDNVNCETGKLVFAITPEEAKTKAFADEMFDNVEYTDLRVGRAKYADGHEKDSERDLLILCIRNCWSYDTAEGHHITGENIDEAITKGWI